MIKVQLVAVDNNAHVLAEWSTALVDDSETADKCAADLLEDNTWGHDDFWPRVLQSVPTQEEIEQWDPVEAVIEDQMILSDSRPPSQSWRQRFGF